jgi:hypothetical protein
MVVYRAPDRKLAKAACPERIGADGREISYDGGSVGRMGGSVFCKSGKVADRGTWSEVIGLEKTLGS